jgi:head-tail adaptor
MRVIFGTRIFNVLSVIEPEMARVSLVLACSEGLNAG